MSHWIYDNEIAWEIQSIFLRFFFHFLQSARLQLDKSSFDYANMNFKNVLKIVCGYERFNCRSIDSRHCQVALSFSRTYTRLRRQIVYQFNYDFCISFSVFFLNAKAKRKTAYKSTVEDFVFIVFFSFAFSRFFIFSFDENGTWTRAKYAARIIKWLPMSMCHRPNTQTHERVREAL